MVKTVMIRNGKSNIAYADRVDWERVVERSCKRNLIAVERPRFVSEAPLDVPDSDTAIDAIQASLPALMVPVQEPDRQSGCGARCPARRAL